jgi:prevent-host-death family protein
MEDILHSTRMLNDLRTNPDKVLSYTRRTGKPVLLTKNGKPEFVVLDVRKAAQKGNAKTLQRMIEEAEADIAAGRYEDFDQYMKRFRNAHNI